MEDRHRDMIQVLPALPPEADLDAGVEYNMPNGERYLVEKHNEGG